MHGLSSIIVALPLLDPGGAVCSLIQLHGCVTGLYRCRSGHAMFIACMWASPCSVLYVRAALLHWPAWPVAATADVPSLASPPVRRRCLQLLIHVLSPCPISLCRSEPSSPASLVSLHGQGMAVQGYDLDSDRVEEPRLSCAWAGGALLGALIYAHSRQSQANLTCTLGAQKATGLRHAVYWKSSLSGHLGCGFCAHIYSIHLGCDWRARMHLVCG